MFAFLQKYNSDEKIKRIAAYFSNNQETVLDFGCGDLSFAKELKRKRKSLHITGVDVVDFHERPESIKFVVYDGKKLPFKNNTFDTVIAFHVLHHTDDARKYFNEIVRVARRRVLLIESVARTSLDFPGMKFMDWLFNIWKPEKVPLTYQFLSKKEWLRLFRKKELSLATEVDAEIIPFPKFFPTGRSILFELLKT